MPLRDGASSTDAAGVREPGPDVRLGNERPGHSSAPEAVASLDIVVAPVGRGRFRASFCGRILVEASMIPFIDAARVLEGEGVDPATRIVMRHEGKDYDALTSTVAAAAKLTVKESTRDGKPRFGDWHPYGGPGAPVAPPMSETGPAVISPHPDALASPEAFLHRGGR